MTASSSVMWTWSLWMTAIYTVVVTSPATLPLPWTSLASGETLLVRLRPTHPHFPQALSPSFSVLLAFGPWFRSFYVMQILPGSFLHITVCDPAS